MMVHAGAQDAPFDERAMEDADELFDAARPGNLRDTTAARNALRDVRRGLAGDRIVPALAEAQRVLDEMRDDFARVPRESSAASLLWHSAEGEALEILRQLPPDVRGHYENLVEPAVTGPMRTLLDDRRLDALEDLALRHIASKQGQRVLRLLMELAAEEGRLRDLERLAMRGIEFMPGDGSTWSALIDVLVRRGDRGTLASLTPPEGSILVTTAEGAMPVKQAIERAIAQLDRERDADGGGARMGPFDGVTWGGTGARARMPHPNPPIPGERRWSLRVDESRRTRDRSQQPMGPPELPSHFVRIADRRRPIMPVAAGRTVYIADGRSVSAVDAFTGARAWHFDQRRRPGLIRPFTTNDGRTNLARAYAPYVDRDRVFATVEVDHEYVRDIVFGLVISTYIPRRRLVSLDRESGAMLWMAGDAPDADPRLQDASVIAPVVARGDRVYAMVAKHDQMHKVAIVAVSRDDGRLLWHRPIGFGSQELNLFGSPLTELAGTALAVHGDTVVGSTGLGMVAAVNARDGRAKWVASYETLPSRAPEYWFQSPMRRLRFGPTRSVIYGDAVVIAPSDGRHVHVFDLATGALRWRHDYERPAHRYEMGSLIGVMHDGRRDVVIVTDGHVRALDLEYGSVAWTGSIRRGRAFVHGEGTICGDEVWVPTSLGIERISWRDEGKSLGRYPWPHRSEPGNLCVLDRALVVASKGVVQGFYDWQSIFDEIEARRRADPSNVALAIEAAELYERGGKLARAASLFAKAERDAKAKKQPALVVRARKGRFHVAMRTGEQDAAAERGDPRSSFREALTFAWDEASTRRAWIAILHSVPEGSAEHIDALASVADVFELDEIALTPVDEAVPARPGAWLAIGALHADAERFEDAVDAYQRVLASDPDVDVDGLPAGVRAKQSIDELIREHGRACYAKHDRAAGALLSEARGARNEAQLTRLLAVYPNSMEREAALLTRAEIRRERGANRAAMQDLRTLVSASLDASTRARVLALIASTEARQGAVGSARAAWRTLRNDHADVSFELDGKRFTGATFVVDGVSMQAAERRPLLAPSRPYREIASVQAADESYMRNVPVHGDGGDAPIALVDAGEDLVAIDMESGTERWRSPGFGSGMHKRVALWTPGVVVVALSKRHQGELVGLDERSGEPMWTQRLSRPVSQAAVADGQIFVSTFNRSPRAAVHASWRSTPWRVRLCGSPPSDASSHGRFAQPGHRSSSSACRTEMASASPTGCGSTASAARCYASTP